MLPSALKKSTENRDEKETKCVTFSRENSVKATREEEGFLAVDKVDAMIDDVDDEISHQDKAGESTLKARKGKKVVHTDSLKCNRARLSKTLED